MVRCSCREHDGFVADGALDDLHLWMLDGVDIRTDWTEERAVENRGARSVLAQIRDVEESLPFTLLGIDSDNGGEFINHHLVRYAQVRQTPLCFTRARAFQSNDNAHVEQRNYTHVRQHFGYERYDNPAAVPLINALCKGALGQMLNHFLPTQKLRGKRREGNQTIREYGDPQTPYTRVLNASEVSRPKEKRTTGPARGTQSHGAGASDREREEGNRAVPNTLCLMPSEAAG